MVGQVFADTVVALARLALFAYAIQSGRAFLLHWLDTRMGLPVFDTPLLTREAAIDACRKYGITDTEVGQRA